MSGYTSQRNRFGSGKSNWRMKPKGAGSQVEWKPTWKIKTDGYSADVSSGQNDNSSHTSEGTLGQMSSDTVSSGPKLKDSSPTQSETSNKHVTTVESQTGRRLDMAVESCNSCSTPIKCSLVADSPMDRLSEKGKQPVKRSREMAGNGRRSEDSDYNSSKHHYDICLKSDASTVKLKAPLLVKNREKRNEIKRFVEGPNLCILRPGMVIIKSFISSNDQIKIVKACRDLGMGEGGFYQPGYSNGATLRLKMMCLGMNWDPQSGNYGDMRPIDNAKPPRIPNYFLDLVKRSIQESHTHIKKKNAKADVENFIPTISPNICIVNFYTTGGKLGLHQDKDESAESINRGLPVVSCSIGDSAEFLYGDVRDIDKAEKVILESGDVLIFGGKSRRIFHGVASILPNTAPKSLLEATDLRPGRLNLTFREY